MIYDQIQWLFQIKKWLLRLSDEYCILKLKTSYQKRFVRQINEPVLKINTLKNHSLVFLRTVSAEIIYI